MPTKTYHERSVLVVDDEQSLRTMIVENLKESIPHVFEAANGMEAKNWLEQNDVDVILSDIMMPHINGISLIESLTQEHNAAICIIMTGYQERSYLKRAIAVGVHDFIDKPFDFDTIVTRIINAIETSQLRRTQGELIVSLLQEYGRTPGVPFAALTTEEKLKCIKQLTSIVRMRERSR